MPRKASLVLLPTLIILANCGKSDANGKGTFPDFYSLAKETVPSTSTSGAMMIALDRRSGSMLPASPVNALVNTFPSSYTTDASQFSDAFSPSQNFIGQVLLDAGPSGTVKSMFVLLAQAQGTMNGINTQYSDDAGNPANCTSIAAGASLTTPFFASATNAAFNSWSDAGKYTCYATRDNGLTAFGRHAIASPSAGCTDAFEYYVMTGYAQDDAPNSEQTASRGTTVDIASIQKFYFNGCTRDLKLAYAQSTKYAAGVEFSSRTEITGNTADHSFSVRADYIDADTTYATHTTIAGTGKSKVADGASGSVNFIMGYRSDNCGTSSNSSSCSLGTARTFCVKNSGTGSNYALEATAANCASLDAAYAAMNPLVRSDLPGGYFSVSQASFGL